MELIRKVTTEESVNIEFPLSFKWRKFTYVHYYSADKGIRITVNEGHESIDMNPLLSVWYDENAIECSKEEVEAAYSSVINMLKF
jgi:hypothetical protein